MNKIRELKVPEEIEDQARKSQQKRTGKPSLVPDIESINWMIAKMKGGDTFVTQPESEED